MPADYDSTARALALPVSPTEHSPPASFGTIRPQWSQRGRSARRGSNTPYTNTASTLRDRIIDRAEQLSRRSLKTYQKMSPIQRVAAIAFCLISLVLTILFLVFSHSIFGWLEPFAESWKSLPGGWLILWAATFFVSFPPLIGYSTCVTTAGFVYGFPEGWFIVASATIIGSTCSFLVSRTILRKFVERLIANDKRFAALALTLKHDGLKLLVMIRFCPLPYSLSNGAMSTFPTVQPLSFAIATAIVSPKLLIHVFIGSRLKVIAKSGGQMSAGTKALNWCSIIFGAALGIFTGWYIYKR